MKTTTKEAMIAELRTFYDSRRRSDEFEPPWIAGFFDDALARGVVADDVREYLRSYKRPHVVDRLMGGKWVEEDGFLVGSASWVFMARKTFKPRRYKGWVIVGRTLSGEALALEKSITEHPLGTFFIAYNDDHPVGMSFSSGSELGPCRSLSEIKALIDDELRWIAQARSRPSSSATCKI